MKKNLDENDLGPPFRAVMLSFLIILVCAAAFCGSVSADSWTDYIGNDAFTNDNITYYGSNNTFVIHTNYGLAWAAKDINTKDTNRTKTFVLGNDIDLSGHDWTPIGIEHNLFSGTFYGNDSSGKVYTISNLSIPAGGSYQGLFGYASNANFTNVNLTNVSISSNQASGSLVGRNDVSDGNMHIIENCSAVGNVKGTGSGTSGIGGPGGLIGNNNINGISSTLTISNCSAAVDVTVTNRFYIGGLIGNNNVPSGTIIIKNCRASGNVSGTDDNAGGLVGRHYITGGKSRIENCYAAGDISGIVGTGHPGNVGGLIGSNYGGSSTELYVKNCYATGDVSGDVSDTDDNAGGLISENTIGSNGVSTIENCYATGNVSGIVTSATGHVGGLIGSNKFDGTGTIYVNNSTALNKYVNHSGTNVGRIVGSNNGGTLNNNYAWKGMKNGDNFFTDGGNNGSSVSSLQVWANVTFYKEVLQWTFDESNWSIISDDTSYPLPYLTSLGKDDSLRNKVIYLKPVYVKFDNNSGEGTMTDQPFTIGYPQELAPNSFTKEGYKFIGWNNSSGGNDLHVDCYDGQPITITADTTLWAVWTKITNVTLYFNNTTSSSKNQVVNISYDSGEFNKTLIKPIYKGHTFLGYNNSSNGGVQVINDTLKLAENVPGYSENGKWKNESSSIELWAVWKANTTKIMLHFNNSSTDENETVAIDYNATDYNGTKPTYPEYANHRFMGYNNSSNGGIQVINDTLHLVPDAQGYTLAGKWVNESKDIDLRAVWARLYNITVIQSEGGNINADKQNATAGETVTLTAAPNSGYKFVSWKATNAADDSPVIIIGNTFIMPDSDVNVTAIFNKIPSPSQGSTSGGDDGYYYDDDDDWTPTQKLTFSESVKISEYSGYANFTRSKVVVSVNTQEGSGGSITIKTDENIEIWNPASRNNVYKFDLSCDGEITGDITVNFVINDYVLEKLGLKPNDAGLKQYDNGAWNELETTFTKKDGIYYYSAVTQSLSSPFEIFFKEGAAKPVDVKPANVTPTEEKPAASPMPVLGLLMGLGVTALVLRRK